MSARTINLLCGAVLLAASGCFREHAARPHEELNSVLWCQSSVEHHISCVQTFRAAEAAVEKALLSAEWTAAIEQTNDCTALPPAVIVDVDETVLDDTPYQARLVLNGKKFDPRTWATWVDEAQADAVPGARQFINFLKAKGVSVFYVTNRSQEEQTVRNLRKVLDPDVTAESVLCRDEQAGWGTDKTSRRTFLAKTHRILVLLGDDYNDFFFLGKSGPQERAARAESHRDYWGTKWFILPNPLYGNWEQALYDYNVDLGRSDMMKHKRRHLYTKQ